MQEQFSKMTPPTYYGLSMTTSVSAVLEHEPMVDGRLEKDNQQDKRRRTPSLACDESSAHGSSPSPSASTHGGSPAIQRFDSDWWRTGKNASKAAAAVYSRRTITRTSTSVTDTSAVGSSSCAETATPAVAFQRGRPCRLRRSFSDSCLVPSRGSVAYGFGHTVGGSGGHAPLRADYVTSCAEEKKIDEEENARRAAYAARRGTTIVVMPSIDLDEKELNRLTAHIYAYEERQLFHLFLLSRDPSIRVVYLTSHVINHPTVEYFLSLACAGDPNLIRDCLSRLLMLTPSDSSPRHLSAKILSRPSMVKLLRSVVNENVNPATTDLYHSYSMLAASHDEPPRGPAAAGMCVWCGSPAADRLSVELGLRVLEAQGEKQHYGTKQGSREIFKACDIPHPPGTPDLDVGDDDLLTPYAEDASHWSQRHRYIRSPRALAVGLARQIVLRNVRPRKWMVKLNQGFSGMGNAILDIKEIQEHAEHCNGETPSQKVMQLAADIEKELPQMKFECQVITWEGTPEHIGFKQQIERLGVIAEAFLDGEVPSSPSIQAVVEPEAGPSSSSSVRIMSTHEQLLDGQVYAGCRNPASDLYRGRIMDYGRRAGWFLARHGVVGHFSCDFLATKKEGGGNSAGCPESAWELNAVEINLRQGGTTHPYSALALLAGGKTGDDGIFRTCDGEERYYVATDVHVDERLLGMTDGELIQEIRTTGDHIDWDPVAKTGSVFHLFRFLQVKGKIGYTSIGSSPEEAQILFDKTAKFLHNVASIRKASNSGRDQ